MIPVIPAPFFTYSNKELTFDNSLLIFISSWIIGLWSLQLEFTEFHVVHNNQKTRNTYMFYNIKVYTGKKKKDIFFIMQMSATFY